VHSKGDIFARRRLAQATIAKRNVVMYTKTELEQNINYKGFQHCIIVLIDAINAQKLVLLA
jgi:hypothetical protein